MVYFAAFLQKIATYLGKSVVFVSKNLIICDINTVKQNNF